MRRPFDPPEYSGLAGILEENRAALRRFLIARTNDPAVADDLLQEVWIRIDRAESVTIGNARAYLFRIANNLVLDRVREERRRAARDRAWSDATFGTTATAGEDVTDPRDDAETTMIDREEVAQLASAIANLPPAAGRAFRMHKLDGLSQAEVAASLGISKSGVEKHIAVAMAHLRRALRD